MEYGKSIYRKHMRSHFKTVQLHVFKRKLSIKITKFGILFFISVDFVLCNNKFIVLDYKIEQQKFIILYDNFLQSFKENTVYIKKEISLKPYTGNKNKIRNN